MDYRSRLGDMIANAYNVRRALDKRALPSYLDAKSYKAHLEDCKKNLTAGLVARQQIINKKPKNYPAFFIRNVRIIEREFDVKEIKDIINAKLAKYNKTRYIRNYIIKSNRLNLDTVTKSLGYTKKDRFLIALKQLFRIV